MVAVLPRHWPVVLGNVCQGKIDGVGHDASAHPQAGRYFAPNGDRGRLTLMTAGFPVGARAKENGVYFVPSGRIGFKQPAEIAPWSNVWALLSTDHTFDVRITETPRLGPDSDGYLWDKDDRSELIPTDLKVPGFEIRCFRDKQYDPSIDYSAQSVVLRDGEWMGNIKVSTGNLGGT